VCFIPRSFNGIQLIIIHSLLPFTRESVILDITREYWSQHSLFTLLFLLGGGDGNLFKSRSPIQLKGAEFGKCITLLLCRAFNHGIDSDAFPINLSKTLILDTDADLSIYRHLAPFISQSAFRLTSTFLSGSRYPTTKYSPPERYASSPAIDPAM
jgi:hypothetical protein